MNKPQEERGMQSHVPAAPNSPLPSGNASVTPLFAGVPIDPSPLQRAQSAPATLVAPPANDALAGGGNALGGGTFAAMQRAKRWLLHINKVPYYAGGGKREAPLDEPDDWARLVTYEVALERLRALAGTYTGLSFALGPDEAGGHWQGEDFDNVEHNRISQIANEAPGYVELSMSGKGCHAIGYGRPFKALGSDGSGIEAYCRGRHFAVTERVLRDAPLTDLADHVERVLAPRRAGSMTNVQIPAAFPDSAPLDPKTVTELRSALNAIPAEDRQVWVAVGMALKTLGDIVGWELWATWSQRSAKWDPNDASRVWDSLKPKDIGYQAIFVRAQSLGWVNPASASAQVPSAEGEWVWWNGDYHFKTPPRVDRLVLRTADTIPMQSIYWLWPGLVACSFLNLLVGETSAGKSTVLADVAARVTTGRAWPGEGPNVYRHAGRVLWLGSEDPMELLTVPRLRACGADLSKVTEIQGVTRLGQRNTFSMQDDISAVRQEIDAAKQALRPYAMLVIDPITSYLHGGKLRKVDLNDSGQLRTVLEPWIWLAQETGIAIVGVTHLAKDTTRSLLHRVLGGGAFAHLCRSLLAVVSLPEEGPFEKAVMQVKSNLPGAPKGSLRFRTEVRLVGEDQFGQQIAATFPTWGHFDPALTPEGIAGGRRGPRSSQSAGFRTWLRNHFEPDPKSYKRIEDVKAAAGQECGVSESWWREHSAEFLDKQNMGGIWMCRPLVAI